jgi:diadenosine tetraphosphatase ApaH/serine/threonine PP2A family protein phosphatase
MMADMLAILYDVHGNLPALDAVLEDADAAGADRYVLGGDEAAFGAWPVEVVERLDSLAATARIRGNWERWQAGEGDPPPPLDVVHGALAHVRDALGPETVDRLAAQPPDAEVEATLFCHASPGSDMVSFDAEGNPDDDANLLAGVAQRRVIFGHTHVQFGRVSGGGMELVNPGSVGFPFDGDTRAAYALLGDDGIELRRVDYDHARAAIALEGLGEPWADTTAARIRAARFDAGTPS